MMIRDMFFDDINRKVNGVIKVDQDETAVVSQEVREYVITKELKKHLSPSLIIMAMPSPRPPQTWVSGFPASSEAVNRTS